MNNLNYKRNNNIYNTHYYIKKTDVGLGVDASRSNTKLKAVASPPNVGLGADASGANIALNIFIIQCCRLTFYLYKNI
jgi:hypothetical protein